MILKLNLRRREDRLKLILILGGGLILFLILSYTALKVSVAPAFCSTCHIMKPEYYTWQGSSHNKVSCVSCHIGPGFVNLIEHKLAASKELYKYATKTYDLPIKMTEPLPDSICLQCHKTTREITPAGDLIIPHETHGKKGISCVKCHSGVAHGQVSSRQLTLKTEWDRWNNETGKFVMDREFTTPRMDLCMDCHKRRNVTLACQACHSATKLPASHKKPDFQYGHGKSARNNVNYCDSCHGFTNIINNNDTKSTDLASSYLKKVLGGEKRETVKKYTENNKFCLDCHKEKSPRHKEISWRYDHGKFAEQPDVPNCLNCHSRAPDAENKVAQTNCLSCHPSSHAPQWRAAHPVNVPKAQALDDTCFKCHAFETCVSCHLTKSDKPPVFKEEKPASPVSPELSNPPEPQYPSDWY